MGNLIKDTLQNSKGEWDEKNITSFTCIASGLFYEFILPFLYAKCEIVLDTKEYVFITLIVSGLAGLGISTYQKVKSNEGDR